MLPICVRFAECRLLSRSRHANCNTSVWDTGAYAGAVRDLRIDLREPIRDTISCPDETRRDKTRRDGRTLARFATFS